MAKLEIKLLFEIHSSVSSNGHFSWQTKNPYIDSWLKPLYDDHLFTVLTFFCPQGGRCRDQVQL